MKKNKLPIIIIATLISALGIYGQKTVNQKGRVREITYSASEQITPIKNVIINYRHGQQEW